MPHCPPTVQRLVPSTDRIARATAALLQACGLHATVAASATALAGGGAFSSHRFLDELLRHGVVEVPSAFAPPGQLLVFPPFSSLLPSDDNAPSPALFASPSVWSRGPSPSRAPNATRYWLFFSYRAKWNASHERDDDDDEEVRWLKPIRNSGLACVVCTCRSSLEKSVGRPLSRTSNITL